jgi:hypothetical protein
MLKLNCNHFPHNVPDAKVSGGETGWILKAKHTGAGQIDENRYDLFGLML